MVNVWRLMAHHVKGCQFEMIRWSMANCRIALGWGLIKNIRQHANPVDIAKAACNTGNP